MVIEDAIKNGVTRSLVSKSGRGGMSGEVSLITYKQTKYALRTCKEHEKYLRYVSVFSDLKDHGVLPSLIDHQDNNLLIEFIEGIDCTDMQPIDVAYLIGQMLARVNLYGNLPVTYDNPDEKFIKKADGLLKSELINKGEFNKALNLYKHSRPKEISLVTEMVDVSPHNYILRDDQVFLVDIQAIKNDLKGRGIARGFLKWFKTPQERSTLLQGYKSTADLEFFSEEYLKFAVLWELILNLAHKSTAGWGEKFITRQLSDLHILLNEDRVT